MVGYTFRVFHGGQTWHPEYGTHKVTLSGLSLLKGKDYWMTFGSAPTCRTSLTESKTQMSNPHNDTNTHELCSCEPTA
jgi:hypothetical protein